jgi:hypothetical protein
MLTMDWRKKGAAARGYFVLRPSGALSPITSNRASQTERERERQRERDREMERGERRTGHKFAKELQFDWLLDDD